MIQTEIISEDRKSPGRGRSVCSQCQGTVGEIQFVCPGCGARLCQACADAEIHHYPVSLAHGEAKVCQSGFVPAAS
jgi:predicted amidophosphoribosyltransferase